jgi:hypothetical protein
MSIEPFKFPESIHQTAEQIIESESRLVIKAYGVIHSTEDFMRAFVRQITERFDRPDLAPMIEIVVKELTMNAVKANFKKIFFAENNFRIDDTAQYELGMARFHEIMDENIFINYGRKARDMKLSVETTFDFNKDRIIVEIRNNAPMARHEEERAREKLAKGFSVTDMTEFMMTEIDETESAGLGLALCLTTMRSSGIDPRLLSIYSDFESETIARIEVPLHAGYVPSRASWQGAMAG